MNKPIYGTTNIKPAPRCVYTPPVGKNINEYLLNLNVILTTLNNTGKPDNAITSILTLDALITDALTQK